MQPAKQERIFSPQTGPGIFGSAADSFSGWDVFCAKCHQNWVKDYLQGMQLFTTHNIGAYHITTAPADWYHGRCTRRLLASSFTLNILIIMRGCRLRCSFQPSGSMCIIKITNTAAPWLKWVRHKEKSSKSCVKGNTQTGCFSHKLDVGIEISAYHCCSLSHGDACVLRKPSSCCCCLLGGLAAEELGEFAAWGPCRCHPDAEETPTEHAHLYPCSAQEHEMETVGSASMTAALILHRYVCACLFVRRYVFVCVYLCASVCTDCTDSWHWTPNPVNGQNIK